MRLHARHAFARFARGVTQVAHLTLQAAQEAAIELLVGVVQHQRRLAEPGDDPPRGDVRLPCHRMKRSLQRDPFIDQRAGVGAGDAGFRGAQVAQPAEAEQPPPPIRPTAA